MKNKSLIILLIILALCLITQLCQAYDLTFTWDYDPNISNLEGFYLYERDNNNLFYDYNKPVSSLISKSSRFHIQKNVSEGFKGYVLRARSTEGLYSDSSNEVTMTVPLVIPSEFNINGLKSGDLVDILFFDGKALFKMIIISYDNNNNAWQVRRPGTAAKDFFIPAGSIKAIVRKN